MSTFSRTERALAAAYAFVAGFVDSVGFVFLGGVFLSFMSGNTTRAATSLVDGDWDLAVLASTCLVLFLVGVMQGALVRRLAKQRIPLSYIRDVVVLNTDVMFVLASALVVTGHSEIGILFVSLGIGSMNSIFERDGEVAIPLTYMTGTLVKMGQRFVDALFGGSHRIWISHLLMWASLTAGAVTGALTYASIGIHAIVAATGMLLAISATVLLSRFRARRGLGRIIIRDSSLPRRRTTDSNDK